MNKYMVEFAGTFFLVLAIVCCVNGDSQELAPIAVGSLLSALVYAGIHISGAHYNPSVTLTILIQRLMMPKDVIPYIVSQTIAGMAASLISTKFLDRSPSYIAEDLSAAAIPPALIAEFLGTFVLVWVILNVATTKASEGNSYYGLAIGFTVLGGAYTLGSFGTYACFNPAVAISLAISGNITWLTALMIIPISILGALSATFFFNKTQRS